MKDKLEQKDQQIQSLKEAFSKLEQALEDFDHCKNSRLEIVKELEKLEIKNLQISNQIEMLKFQRDSLLE